MKLGTHNSMSYSRPVKWLHRIFHFISKCQEVTIEEQYEKYNVRLFDLRLKYNWNKRKWYFAHGSTEYEADIKNTLDYLNSKKDCVVRLVLEYNKPVKHIDQISAMFVLLAIQFIKTYKNIKFFEFARKYDWEILLPSNYKPSYYQAVSSTTWKVWDDWYPYLYAHRFNKENLEQGTNKEFLLLDFINIQ